MLFGTRRPTRPATSLATLRGMRLLRRALMALSVAGAIAAALRVKGKGGVPPQQGGWREVNVPPK